MIISRFTYSMRNSQIPQMPPLLGLLRDGNAFVSREDIESIGYLGGRYVNLGFPLTEYDLMSRKSYIVYAMKGCG